MSVQVLSQQKAPESYQTRSESLHASQEEGWGLGIKESNSIEGRGIKRVKTATVFLVLENVRRSLLCGQRAPACKL